MLADAHVRKVAASDDFKAYLTDQYADPKSYMSAADAQGFLANELANMKKFAKEAGMAQQPMFSRRKAARIAPYVVVLGIAAVLYRSASGIDFFAPARAHRARFLAEDGADPDDRRPASTKSSRSASSPMTSP